MDNNTIEISGIVAVKPTLSHELHGEKFYSLEMVVKRKSNREDYVPVIISEYLIDVDNVNADDCLHLKGEVRTRNKVDETGKHHLSVYVFVKEVLEPVGKDNINELEFTGTIVRAPFYRKTPLGREITDLLIAVNGTHGRSAYIPCIAWGRTALKCSTYAVGTKVYFAGRFQSREYSKYDESGIEELKVAYEMSADTIEEIVDKMGEVE